MTSDLRPIIIGGFYRSGTSLLRRLLNAHSQIHCPAEIKFFRDLELDFAEDPYAHLRFFTTVRCLPIDVDDLLNTLGRGYIQLRRIVLERVSKTIWADKDPENALYLKYWRQLIPEGFRYIHIGRYPLDMLASAHEAAFVKTLPPSSTEILQRWLNNCTAAMEFQRISPAQFYLIRYEDLVGSPENTLSELFRWLQLPFDSGILTRFANQEDSGGIEDPKVISNQHIHNQSVNRGLYENFKIKPSLLADCRPVLEWLGYTDWPVNCRQL